MTAIGEATIMIGDTPDVAAVVDQRTDAIFVVSDVSSRGTSSIGPAIVVKDDDKFPTVRQIIVQLSGTEEEGGELDVCLVDFCQSEIFQLCELDSERIDIIRAVSEQGVLEGM